MALEKVSLEVVTLFVDDIVVSKQFYLKVFEVGILYEDSVSCVLQFDGTLINLLQISQAPQLVTPASTASARAGAQMLLTIRVEDVDAASRDLEARGVTLLNGPIDRPWGRRTAAFADPSGHVWELAQELTTT